MYLKRMQLKNYRNYSSLKISFNKGINIIYGDNAQGKTNLLESIYVLAHTNTFRNNSDVDLIYNGKQTFNLNGVIKKEKLDNVLNINFANYKKQLIIDNSDIHKVSDYISNMNVILFTPDDLDVIKGPPIYRRNYLNTELSQLYRNYYVLLNEYEKVLKMRNDYLKMQKYDYDYYDILTSFFIEKNILIYKIRRKFIDKINLYCNNIFKNIVGVDNFKIVYKPNFDYSFYNYDKNLCLKLFQDKYESEFKFLNSFYGVHKDDFEFILNGINLKQFGSQGQQRLAVLVLKLSELEIFKHIDKIPILLLDDVFSEIDEEKCNKLLKYLSKDLQVIITAVSLHQFDKNIIKNAKIFKISEGKIKLQRGDNCE